jgi:shikimate kinase/3-dehydroquinate synthase
MAGELSTRGAIVIVGFMGAGKTTAARALARARGGSTVDADSLIEERLGTTISQAFARDGEPAFRAVEETVVGDLLDRASAGEIISLSGGAIGSERGGLAAQRRRQATARAQSRRIRSAIQRARAAV